MIRSMTGFARWHEQDALGDFAWELRSVNHRYLEVGFRMPEEFRELEPALRERASARLGRGKVECQLRFQRDDGGQGGARVDRDALKRLDLQMRTVKETLGAVRDPAVLDVLRWPGVLVEEQQDAEPVQKRALEGFEAALDGLVETRTSEGARIHEMLVSRLDRVAEMVEQVRGDLPAIREALKGRLQGRLEEIEASVDPGRLEQELVFHLTRMDVDEELDRLEAHVAEMRGALDEEAPVGRRLDFLMQEFNREANTLASKSQAARTTGAAVELKVLIEQMREQIQNVE